MFWKKKMTVPNCVTPRPTAEFDIEGLPVLCVDRHDDETTRIAVRDGTLSGVNHFYITCTEGEHFGFVARFQSKVIAESRARFRENKQEGNE